MIEPTEDQPGEDIGEETYGMYLRRVSGSTDDETVWLLENALDSIKHETQPVYRDGVLGDVHVWYIHLDYTQPVKKDDHTQALYEAFFDCLQQTVLARIKQLYPTVRTLNATLPAYREWVSVKLPGWVAGEQVSGQGFGSGFMDDAILRFRLNFVAVPPLVEGEPAWLTTDALISRVRTTPLLKANFHALSSDSEVELQETTIVTL